MFLPQNKTNKRRNEMIYNQDYIITELRKTLEKMIILPQKKLINLIAIIIGIIDSKSVVLSNIAEKLKDGYNYINGEEIFYISNPALGLWAFKERFYDKK